MAKKVNIEDYTFIRKLGQGGFGRVVFAKCLKDHKFYAVKVFAKETLIQEKSVKCIRREKSLMAQVDHPFIVNLVGYGKDTKLSYLIMECATGGDLEMQISKAQRFPDQLAQFYAAQMVLALAHIHEMNIVHRDIKPENVLMCPNGYIKMCDFGLAKQLELGKRAFTFCGTPNYMAPEIILHKGQSITVDWWSLGVLIYKMIVGNTPWTDRDEKQLYSKILDGSIYFPSYMDKRAKNLLKRLCIADLSLRYGDLKDGVQDVLDHKWFAGMDWEDLKAMQIPAPFQPSVINESDTSNFQSDGSEPLGRQLRAAHSVCGSQDPFQDW